MVFRLVGISRPERDPFSPGRTRTAAPKELPLGRRKKYPNALRKAVQEILSDGPAEVRIFRGTQLVAVCERQYAKIGKRGGKFSVRCSGEKPAKRKH